MNAPPITPERELQVLGEAALKVLLTETDPDRKAILRDHIVEIIDECFRDREHAEVWASQVMGDSLLASIAGIRLVRGER